MKRPHQISKLIFEIDVPEMDSAYAIQNEASSFIKNEIDKIFNQLLDKYDVVGKVIHINKIEIDLRSIQFTPQGRPLLMEEFRQKLEEQLSGVISQAIYNNETIEGEYSSGSKNKITISDETDDEINAILFFLRHGYIPWWAEWMVEFDLNKTVEQLLNTRAEEFINALEEKLPVETFRLRIIRQLQLPVIHKLLISLTTNKKQDEINEIIYELVQLKPNKNICFELLFPFSRNFSAEKIPELFDKIYNLESEKTNLLLQHFPKENESFVLVLKAIARMKTIPFATKTTLLNSVEGKHPLIMNEEFIEKFIKKNESLNQNSLPNKSSKQNKNSILNKSLNQNKNSIQDDYLSKNESLLKSNELFKNNETNSPIFEEEKEENLITAFYSGLVLIQPYLISLFKELEMVEKSDFINSKIQHHAVYILYYLATGLNQPEEEYRLVIPKLLCGIDPEEPLDEFTELTEKETEECENLLKAVIENWGAIKKTSPQGLREMFLKRQGQLKYTNNNWTLYIEREAADVLLDKLPWGISMLRASWNREIIYVEW